jgi:hypothetical protein
MDTQRPVRDKYRPMIESTSNGRPGRLLQAALTVAIATLVAGCQAADIVRLSIAAQLSSERLAGPLPLELPFVERDGLVIVPVAINGKATVNFVLDTGAPVTVLLVGDEAAPLALDLSGARKLGSEAASPVGAVLFDFDLDFGPLLVEALPMIAVPIDTMPCRERLDAVGFRGAIGRDLFRRFVVEIDYDAGRVRLHAPEAYRDDGGGAVLPLEFEDGHIFTRAGLHLPGGAAVDGVMHVDTGMNSPLSLLDGGHPAITAPADGERRQVCLVNGLQDVVVGAPLRVTFGRFDAADVPTSYLQGRRGMKHGAIGTLGAGLLRRWNLVIDYPGRRFILKPRKTPASTA